ncbi:MAG TPA: IS66 family transposase [Pyrinomonadaceae bacterium]|jgi:predicted RecB family nuclease|nr:IS66 family transposase [Pyrinomonadaceae bacterium]
MVITEEIFGAFLKCETKSFLKLSGGVVYSNEFSEWQQHDAEAFREKCRYKLRSDFSDRERASASLLLASHKNGEARLLIDHVARSAGLQSNIHALERLSSSSDREKNGPFIPIRFVPAEKVTTHDKLLLAFDALALSSVSGRMLPFGKIMHGGGQKVVRVQVGGLMKKVRSAVKKIAAQQASGAPPQLILNKHCAECEFRERCRRIAAEKDDLSLLSSMTAAEVKNLNEKGIFTVNQLSYTFRPRRRSKRSAAKPEKYHHALKALAVRERKIHVAGRPELDITGTPIYLDVEGVPDRNFYYLIGARIKIGDSYAGHAIWADGESDEREMWASFLRAMAKVEAPRLIHYGSYETVFLKRMKERYGTAGEDPALAERLASEAVNLLSVVYAQIYFPTYSNGLKEIAQYLGFRWSDAAASGLSSVVRRAKWESSRDPVLKQSLIAYNAEDCEALERVTAATDQLSRRASETTRRWGGDVVHTDSLKLKSSYRFGENGFLLPDLERINRSAYWSYQRDKIYVRSSPRLKHISKKTPARAQGLLPINTTIDCATPAGCPMCGSERLRKHGKCRKVVYDLKFSRIGIRRWVVRYEFHRYFCLSCAATFNSQPQNQANSKHGLDLLAYIVYQLVELKIPQGTVANSVSRLFGLPMGRNAVNKQKSRAAEIYKGTYDGILERILGGRLIHADETRVNVRRGSAYVWVLTNLEEVAYFCTSTREGERVKSLLKDFKGVLVTDFYAAYDSIDCPQQKCLVHLIRDLNDDLSKQPFNEELRDLVREFAGLVKPMIDTIDRFGLKAHFLRKHKGPVERFYRSLSYTDFKTEIVVKYKKRFERNRAKLFTFLDYDGVPWNNNNAEHAIKAFAMLRIAIRGASSENGIADYLTLLSICETCKYKGIDFLRFLRSGGVDIDKFIEEAVPVR